MNDSTILTDPYIYVINDILSEDKCNKIIEKFNRKKTQQIQGRTGGGLNTNVKNSRDIQITHSKGWKREDKLFHDIIAEGHRRYYDHLNDPMVNNFVHFTNNMKRHIFSPFYADQKTLELMDTGYQIQKTEPGKGYVWHDDFSQYGTTDSPEIRYLTFILYLNTVEEGWTQFYNGNQVSPKSGRLVFFPATWTYVHQGYPPKQTKYIMTGWMHTKVKAPEQNGKN